LWDHADATSTAWRRSEEERDAEVHKRAGIVMVKKEEEDRRGKK